MIQIIPAAKTFGSQFGSNLGKGLAEGFERGREQKSFSEQISKENDAIKKNFGIDLTGINDPKQRQEIVSQILQGQQKESMLNKKEDFLSNLFNKDKGNQNVMNQEVSDVEKMENPYGFDPSEISDEDIVKASSIDKNVGSALQHLKDVSLREKREELNNKRHEFEENRKYHTQFSKESAQEIEKKRNSLPKLENALNHARNSIETGELSYFSPDKLADYTGIDLFRTAKGAQLITAGKENLLGNMSRVSARGQNIWFEQRLNSMFPKIGQSKEANLTVQEMLEGEAAIEKSYISEYDRLAEEDMKEYGYERKDINKRSQNAVKFKEKEIMRRTSYRMKEVEEVEKGLSTLKNQVGKNVPKGTPLTLAMAKLYKDKFGDKALEVEKKNGYYIPTLEEFKMYQSTPQEFRENL